MRALLALLTTCLLLGGCLQSESTTVLKKDGSGTFTEITTVDMAKAKEAIAQLKALARGVGRRADASTKSPLDAVDADKRAKALKAHAGVTVTSTRRTHDKEKQTTTYVLALTFDSLKQLYAAGVVANASVKLERVDDGKAWKLTVRRFVGEPDREPLTDEAAERLRRMRAALLARYKKLWGAFEATSTLRVPTRVLATNGEARVTKEGHEVTWRIGYGDLADPAALVQHVTFEDAEGLGFEPFEITSTR